MSGISDVRITENMPKEGIDGDAVTYFQSLIENIFEEWTGVLTRPSCEAIKIK